MKYLLFLLSIIVLPLISKGQFQVRDSALFNPHVTISYAYHTPGGDMAERFGNNGGLGMGFHIKSKTNWYYGVQGTYFFGKRVTEPGLLSNLYTDNYEILDDQGQIAKIYIQERGFSVTANGGYIFNALGPNRNSGLLVMGGVGFLQHKIRIEHQENEIRFLEGDYLKGYDRLTNGLTTYEFLGYYLMSTNKMVNFIAGVEAYQGFTQGRRTLNFDTGVADNSKRFDALLGVRVGWVVHLYSRIPDQYYYN
jgi:hypothetical protein